MVARRVPALVGAAACALALLPAVVRADVHAQGSAHSVELRGSTAVYPLAQRVAEAYMREHPDASVVVTEENSYRGLKAMIVGTAEIAMATDVVPDDLDRLARDRGVKFARVDIYRDALVPVIHPANPVSAIALGQLRDVFRGAIVNWKDVGGNDAGIHVVSHEGPSGTYEIFRRTVLGEGAVVTPSARMLPHRELVDAVGKDPTAIGYVGMHEAHGLKVLTVDGVAADAASITSGRYPVHRQLSLYAREPLSGEAKSVIDFFLDPAKGQAMVRELGDVPIK